MDVEAKELRIGNICKSPLNGEPIEITISDIQTIENEEEYFSALKISTDLLMRAGFKVSHNSLIYIEINQSMCLFFNVDLTCYISSYLGLDHYALELSEIKYWHQLQNIFFDLSNYELKSIIE